MDLMQGGFACAHPHPTKPATTTKLRATSKGCETWEWNVHLLKSSILQSQSAIKDLINADHVNEIYIVATTAAAIVFQRVSRGFYDDEEIVMELRRALSMGKENKRKARVEVIDHIVSMLSVLIPNRELTR
ncbi:hypothetical protein ACLOJK_002185 [Asimina triloba]